ANLLRFVPDANENGNPYATIGFQVSDGTDFSAATYTLTVNVTAVNDAPTSTDDSITTLEDNTVFLAAGDFGTYADIESTPLAAVKITSTPTDGVLQHFVGGVWTTVVANDVISRADIDANLLRFVPDANENGNPYATIGFQVSDGTDFSAAAYTLTVNVTAVNDGHASLGITGVTQSGHILSANLGADPDGAESNIHYTWLRDNVSFGAADASTYALTNADVGHKISVETTYTDGQGFNEDVTSAQTATISAAGANNAPVVSAPDTVKIVAGNNAIGLGITATDADGDTMTATITGLPGYGTVQYFNGSTWTAVSVGTVLTSAQLASVRYLPPATGAHTGGDLTFSVTDGIAPVSTTIHMAVADSGKLYFSAQGASGG